MPRRRRTSSIEFECAQAIRQQQSALAKTIVDRQYEQQPGIWRPFGDPGRAKCVRDAGCHLTYLAEALAAEGEKEEGLWPARGSWS